MIVFGGSDTNGNNLNDVWVLTNANGLGGTGQWINLFANGAAGSPPARSGHSAAYDSVNNIMIIFGGCSGSCAPELNDVWTLSNANGLGGTPVWTQLSLSGGPDGQANGVVAYDPAANWLIVISGQDEAQAPCASLSDVWVVTNANGQMIPSNQNPPGWFHFSSESGEFPPRTGAVTIYDPTTRVMTVFGGDALVNDTCQPANAVWQLAELFGFWQDLIPNGASGSPPARSFASGVYDLAGGTNARVWRNR